MKKFSFFAALLCAFCLLFAHPNSNFGEIIGTITDADTGETLPSATVQIIQGSTLINTIADIDGFYTLKPLNPGSYDIQFSFVGYQPQILENVLLSGGEILTVNIQLQGGILIDMEPVAKAYRIPLLAPGKAAQGVTFGDEDIQKMPTRSIQTIVSQATGVYQADEGDPINIRGARTGSTQYIIDGVKTDNPWGVPTRAIEQMEVITGGIPAKYGDTTGGVILITTKSGL